MVAISEIPTDGPAILFVEYGQAGGDGQRESMLDELSDCLFVVVQSPTIDKSSKSRTEIVGHRANLVFVSIDTAEFPISPNKIFAPNVLRMTLHKRAPQLCRTQHSCDSTLVAEPETREKLDRFLAILISTRRFARRCPFAFQLFLRKSG